MLFSKGKEFERKRIFGGVLNHSNAIQIKIIAKILQKVVSNFLKWCIIVYEDIYCMVASV